MPVPSPPNPSPPSPPSPSTAARRAVYSTAPSTPPTALQVTGSLPAHINGTLWRNGAGIFTLAHATGSTPVGHWFDAPSLLHAFTISSGTVAYCARSTADAVLADAASCADAAAWAARDGGRFRVGVRDPCRGLFGKAMAMWKGAGGGGVNVGVTVERVPGRGVCARSDMPTAFVVHEERWEGELKGEVVEEEDFFNWASVVVEGEGGRLKGEMSASHGEFDEVTGEYYNFVYGFKGLGKVDYKVFCIGADGKGKVVATIPHDPTYCHSITMTDKYVVLLLYPLRMKPATLLWERSLEAAMEFDPAAPATFYVIDRRGGGGVVATYTAPAFFAFHFINARDTPDGDIEIDICHFDDARIISQLTVDNLREREAAFFSTAQPWRYTLPSVADGRGGEAEARHLCDTSFELPRINPLFARKEYRFAYGPAPGFSSGKESSGVFSCLVKVDFETGKSTEWRDGNMHCSEAIFVPDPSGEDEDDGTLLTVCYSVEEERSFLVALNARDMTEIARAYTPNVVPAGFHGAFVA